LQLGVSALRFGVGLALIAFVASRFISVESVSGELLLAGAAIAMLCLIRFSEPLYRRIEGRFVSNLRATTPDGHPARPEIAPWDATLAEFAISVASPLVGKPLAESGIKERFGVTVVMIERGERRILAPSRSDLLLPQDRIFLIGTDEQLAAVRAEVEVPVAPPPPVSESFGLFPLVLLPTDPFVNRTIRECGLREAVQGLIVGLERGGKRHLSPDSSLVLLPGDLAWIVGDRDRLRQLRN
jgi:CPA2 family monovalent cation:H+ antiporter-2